MRGYANSAGDAHHGTEQRAKRYTTNVSLLSVVYFPLLEFLHDAVDLFVTLRITWLADCTYLCEFLFLWIRLEKRDTRTFCLVNNISNILIWILYRVLHIIRILCISVPSNFLSMHKNLQSSDQLRSFYSRSIDIFCVVWDGSEGSLNPTYVRYRAQIFGQLSQFA